MSVRGRGLILARAGMAAALLLVVVAGITAPLVWLFAVSGLTLLYGALLAGVTRGAARARLSAPATEHAALHDPVTELPNRVLFHDRVHQAIARAEREGYGLGVLVLDL